MKKTFLILLLIITGCSSTTSNLNKLGYNKEEINIIERNLSTENIEYIMTIPYNNAYIKLMENENYNDELFKQYINYLTINNSPIDDTILLVNNNITTEYNEKLVSLINEKYYIKENYDRYYKYLLENPNLSSKQIVTNINSNLDYEYYTTDYDTNIDKNNLLIVNKYYKLSSDYKPDNLIHVTSTYGGSGHYLRKEAFENYKLMYNDMKLLGLNLLIRSSYRSYNYQTTLYNNYVARDGKINADTYSARPGYSEHQTGLAIDVGTPSTTNLGDFEYTDEYKWMTDNAHKYGFILRYKSDTVDITGYMYEPWHYRYVGIEAATYIYENNITFEEYYEYFVK